MRIFSFLTIAVALYAGIHYYIYRNLINLGLSRPAVALALWALALSFPLVHFSGFASRGRIPAGLDWFSSLWIGLAFILVFCLGLAALLSIIFRIVPGFPELGRHVWISGAVALSLILTVAGLVSAFRGPFTIRYPIDRSARYRQGKSLRIVQLTDFHLLTGRESLLPKAVSISNALAPDLVFITGDLIEAGIRDSAAIAAGIRSLRARLGIYAVIGNHEYYAGVRHYLDIMRDAGIPVLQNQMLAGPEGIQIAGVNDPGRPGTKLEGPGMDVELALRDLRTDGPSILLSHQPVRLDEAVRKNVDLILAGHTHGGQIFPFHFFIRLAYRYWRGLYHLGPQTDLIVSNGTGAWGPPLRLFAPAQIVVVDFKY